MIPYNETRNRQSGLARDGYNELTPEEEARIRESIAALKEKLPPIPHEPAEPLQAVVTKVFPDGAVHTRTVDIANEWKRVGHGIREAVRQGGEVTMRPLFPGEGVQEYKEYPSTKRIKALEEALEEAVAALRGDLGFHRSVDLAIESLQAVLDAGKAGAA